MKQLLFTFFAVVLCYSLFFDQKQTPAEAAADEFKYKLEDASPIFYMQDISSPTLKYSSLNANLLLTWNPSFENPMMIAPLALK